MRGTWREGSFTGDPERYAKYRSGNGRVPIEAPLLGKWRDAPFLGPLREGKNFLIRRNF
jgi:hypothetical protein